MSNKVSDCCGAEVEKSLGYTLEESPLAGTWDYLCTKCGKPCGVKSEPEIGKMINIMVGGDLPYKPTPAPESRLLKAKQQYVIGFLFNYTAETVLLIQKNRPDWQKGKLNGVGGHVESGEKPDDAMKREFYEEAGLQLDWDFFCTMVFPECEVHCFRHIDKSGHIIEVEQKTDEFVDWYNYNQVPYNVIPNLHWLIPMALQKEEYMTEVITDAKTSALVRAECQGEVVELRDALNGILGYAEEYHVAFEGEEGKTRDWYLQAVSHAQEVSKKYQALKASVEGK